MDPNSIYRFKDHDVKPRNLALALVRMLLRHLRHISLSHVVGLVILLIAVLCLVEIRSANYKLSRLSSNKWTSHMTGANHDAAQLRQAWIRADHLETGYLSHVAAVLKSLKISTDGGTYSNWHLLWSHEFPFSKPELQKLFANLKPHQKVNKLPGSGYVTSKVSLATSDIKHVPKAFKLPADRDKFNEYEKSHPDAMWVQKSNNHRGIHITPVTGLDLTQAGTFVQQYVDRPMIIDKRKFDIGVYTVVTSVDPLRIYIINHDMLLRFCAHDYYPFDASDRDKYVVTDNYTPVWEIPSLNKYYKQGFTTKQAFLQYLDDSGKNGDGVMSAIEETVRDVYLSKIQNIRDAMSSYSQRNFFEMVRFDFVLDEDANLYLMEVNMSPNLSSKHFPPNRILYEQVLYNLFHLVGLAGAVDHSSQLEDREQDMLVGPRSISANPHQCATLCDSGCLRQECKLCSSCMHNSDRYVFEDAYREHTNRRNTKRVMPPTFPDRDKINVKPSYWNKLSIRDQTMHDWFAAKCQADVTWCN